MLRERKPSPQKNAKPPRQRLSPGVRLALFAPLSITQRSHSFERGLTAAGQARRPRDRRREWGARLTPAAGPTAIRYGSLGHDVPIKAVLFDLGNTLVGYFHSAEFPSVLRRCLRECSQAQGLSGNAGREETLFERALQLNTERPDFAVRPLGERLRELFEPHVSLDDVMLSSLGAAFLKPIFDLARLDPQAFIVLESLRRRGIKTAIVSNTPWGSPASAWRTELARHGLLECVDAVVFCVEVGWRKPHRAPFDRALALLDGPIRGIP